MSPITLLVVGASLALVPALVASEAAFARWGVQSSLEGRHFALVALGTCALLAGIVLARYRPRRAARAGAVPRIIHFDLSGVDRAWRLLFRLLLFGYFVWAVSAVRNGMTFDLALQVLKGEPGANYRSRELLTTVPGLSTLTEVGPCLVALGTVQWRSGSPRFFGMTVVLLLGTLRAFLNSERLGVIYLLLPILLVIALVPKLTPSGQPVRASRRRVLAAVLCAPIALIGLFAVTERGRSWNAHYSEIYNGGLIRFSIDRVWAYYATAMNNGAIYETYYAPQISRPELSLKLLFDAPVFGDLLAYTLGGQPTEQWIAVLGRYGNPEFNNPSALLPIAAELGPGLAMVMFFAWGVFVGALYKSLSQGSLAALCGYCGVAAGLLELARFPYYSSGRLVPSLIAIVVVARLCASDSVVLEASRPQAVSVHDTKAEAST